MQPFQSNQAAQTAIVEHDREGIAILTARPSRLFRATLAALFALVLAGVCWSFVGRADVIVKASGKLGPESEERLVYTPIDGQLADLYVTEGTPVVQGDVLARLNAPTAVQVASQLQTAELKLEVAEQAYQSLPLLRKSTEQYVKTHQFQIETAERAQQLRFSEWREKLAEEQRIKLEKARLKQAQAKQAMDFARDDWQKHLRLFKSANGGGIASSKVKEKRNDYLSKQVEYRTATNDLAEFELQLQKDYAKKQKEIDGSKEQLLSLYAQLAERQAKLVSDEVQTLAQVEMARAELAGLKKIKIDDLDEDNMLRIKAPVSGVVTNVYSTQPGAKVEQKTPFAGIAPADARTVLQLEIPEQQRALLKEGLPVKVKFNAFPYQRYGFIAGELEYIAPSATFSNASTQNNRPLVFKARVSLSRLSFTTPGDQMNVPLRYGMTAVAEIVVQRRRLIDLALDPFRRAAG